MRGRPFSHDSESILDPAVLAATLPSPESHPSAVARHLGAALDFERLLPEHEFNLILGQYFGSISLIFSYWLPQCAFEVYGTAWLDGTATSNWDDLIGVGLDPRALLPIGT